MILSLSGQWYLFWNLVVLGMGIGFIFDVFRTIRNIFDHPSFLVMIEDFVYWIMAMLIVFFYMLQSNDGEIRPFAVIAVFVGMIGYFLVPSKIFMAASNTVVMIIKNIFMLIVEILFTPFKVINSIFGGIFSNMWNNVKRFVKKVLIFLRRYVNIEWREFKHMVKVIFRKV